MSQPLLNLAAGSMIKLNETAAGVTSAIRFLVAAHGHHAQDRTTLLRYRAGPPSAGLMLFQKSGYPAKYASSLPDTWLEGTYLGYLDQAVRDLLTTVSIRAGMSGSLSRAVFLLSVTELGLNQDNAYAEGTHIPYFDKASRRLGNTDSGGLTNYWTRSISSYRGDYVYDVSATGSRVTKTFNEDTARLRPALTLPSALQVSDVPDGDGCYLPSFAAGMPVRVSGAWQTAEPRARAEGAWLDVRPKIKVSGVWYDAG